MLTKSEVAKDITIGIETDFGVKFMEHKEWLWYPV